MTHSAFTLFSRRLNRITTMQIILVSALLHFVILGIVDPVYDGPKYLPIAGATYRHTGMEGVPQLAHTFITTGQFSHEPGGIPVAYRMPLHYLIFGISTLWNPAMWPEIWAVMATAMFFGVLLMTRKIALMLGLSANATKISLACYGLNPIVLWHARDLASWLTASLIILAIGWLLLQSIQRLRWRTSLALGVVTGLGCLTHGSFLLLPLALLITILILSNDRIAARFGHSICVMVVAYCMLAPWTVRNYLTFHKLIPSTTGTGLQFWVAEYVYQHPLRLPVHTSSFHLASQIVMDRSGQALAYPYAGVLDLKHDAVLTQAAKEYLLQDPKRIPRHVLMGFYSFWAPLDSGWKKSLLSAILNWPAVIFCWVGMWTLMRRKQLASSKSIIALLVIICYFWGVFGALQAISSYYITLLPVFYLTIATIYSKSTPVSAIKSYFNKY